MTFLKKKEPSVFFEKKNGIFYVETRFRSLKCPPDVDWIVLVIQKTNSDGIQFTFKDVLSFLISSQNTTC